jgi:cell volume regulation protein A
VSSLHTVEGYALVASLIAIAALALEPVAARFDLPAPLVFLLGGLVLGSLWPSVRDAISPQHLGAVGSIALVVILVDGGLRLGWNAFRREVRPILLLGGPGTAATFALVSVAAHVIVGLGWTNALVIGAVLSPTDPAAVFSVLARRGLASRRVPAVLEGEAGVNDPVSIALTLALVEGAQDGGSASALHVLRTMAEQGVIGAAVGILGGLALGRLLGPLRPSIGAAPALLALLGGFAAYGGAAVLGGSGFLAAYLLGLVLGDRPRVAERQAILDLHGHLAVLGEIGMFVLLGISLTHVDLSHRIVDGLLLALVLTLAIRPLVALPVLRACGFTRNESLFGVWGGLKGAVPVLLGSLPLAAGLAAGSEIFAVTGVVVIVSLALQGASLGRVSHALGLEAEADEPSYHGSVEVSSPR